MKNFAALLLIPALMFHASCTNHKKADQAGKSGTMSEISIENISHEAMGYGTRAVEKPHFSVIRNEEEYKSTWEFLHYQGEERVRPEVDFSKEMLLLAMMGEQPSSGYIITIESVKEKKGVLVAKVRLKEPGPMCMNLTVMTNPHHFIKIPASDLEVKFEPYTDVVDCED